MGIVCGQCLSAHQSHNRGTFPWNCVSPIVAFQPQIGAAHPNDAKMDIFGQNSHSKHVRNVKGVL